ncbi:MAG: acyltransferase [Sulfurimonas sp.]|jgi:peptidoglycan/LPS O-acetylase OafA/YrhL
MFGYLRFALAFLVVLSHIGARFYSLNPGVIAVVIFYILAGFVVSHLYKDIFSPKAPSIGGTFKLDLSALLPFYKDRLLRIYPLYLFVIALTTIFLLTTSYANSNFTLTNIVTNLTIIPLNYFMYIDSTVLSNPSWWLIPPAWSLGTELQAYLLLPFALISKRVKLLLALISFIIYTAANFSLLNPDYFGYRFIVGVFFIFLLGAAIQSNKQEDRYYIITIFALIATLSLYFTFTNSFSQAYTKETFIGILLGIPLVYTLSHIKITLAYNKLLGSLSYGIFLSHFLVIWLLDSLGIAAQLSTLYILQLTTISIIISYLGVLFVEKIDITRKYIIK